MTIERVYEGVSEFLGKIERGRFTVPSQTRASLHDSDDFAGSDLPEAIHLLKNGWPEGREMITELTNKVSKIVGAKIVRDVAYHDVSGAYVDVGRFIDGEPECMVEYRTGRDFGTRTITIVCSISQSCHVDKKEIMKNGTITAAIVDGFEQAGLRCKVVIGNFIAGHKAFEYEPESPKFMMLITVKEWDQPLDMDRLAFTLAHPAMLRRLVLANNEQEPMEIIKRFGFQWGGGYGTPQKIFEHVKAKADVVLENDLYRQYGNSIERMAHYVCSVLKQNGVVLEDDAGSERNA